jgi:hypothetical protein
MPSSPTHTPPPTALLPPLLLLLLLPLLLVGDFLFGSVCLGDKYGSRFTTTGSPSPLPPSANGKSTIPSDTPHISGSKFSFDICEFALSRFSHKLIAGVDDCSMDQGLTPLGPSMKASCSLSFVSTEVAEPHGEDGAKL